MKFFIFFSVVFVITCLVFLYTYRSFKRRFTHNYKILRLFLIAISIVSIVGVLLAQESVSSYFFMMLLYTAVAVLFMLFFTSVIFDILWLFYKKHKKFQNLAFLVISFLYILGSFYGGLKEPKVTQIDIYIKNLQTPLKLALLGDIHQDRATSENFLNSLITKINAQNADAILIVGDMFDIKASELKNTLNPLKNAKMPVFFVTGNHEFYYGVKELVEALKGYGVRVLENESVEFKEINIAGVHDMTGLKFGYFKPDIDMALEMRNPKLPTILMAHQPLFVYKNLRDEVDLYLSGHTHGGQIFPFGIFVWLQQGRLYGLKEAKNSQIYITRGAGFWAMPMRFLAPSEIAILNLKGVK